MSRYYHIDVEIHQVHPDKVEDVIIAAKHIWNWDYVNKDSNQNYVDIFMSGDDFLYGGTSEEEFAEYLSELVWDVHKQFCEINVYCTYLEHLPYDVYQQDINAYTKFIQKKKKVLNNA